MDRKNQINLLCQFLKIWRSSRRISQEQVYIASGIDVSNYEIGRCEPGLFNILMLCDFYGISFSWLLKSAEETDSGLTSEAEFLDKAKKREG
jgi:transcriptional regulator with XRE-family HTH domain